VRQAILADTGPLYAAADRSDQYHRRAQAELGQLHEQGMEIWIAYPTLLEAYTLVLRRLGGPTARAWLGEVLAGGGLINPNPADYSEAARLTGEFSSLTLTLFDTVVAALSKRLGLAVWTYDHHFRLLEVEAWSGR